MYISCLGWIYVCPIKKHFPSIVISVFFSCHNMLVLYSINSIVFVWDFYILRKKRKNFILKFQNFEIASKYKATRRANPKNLSVKKIIKTNLIFYWLQIVGFGIQTEGLRIISEGHGIVFAIYLCSEYNCRGICTVHDWIAHPLSSDRTNEVNNAGHTIPK